MERNICRDWVLYRAGREGLPSIGQNPFVKAFIDRNREQKRIASTTRTYTYHGLIIADMAGDIGRRVWSQEVLDSLERMVNPLKRMLVDTIDEHSASIIYTLKYHLLDYMVSNIRQFETLFVFDSRSYDQLNVCKPSRRLK